MRYRLTLLTILVWIALAMTACTAVAASEGRMDGNDEDGVTVLTLDMAEDFTRFVLDASMVDEEGMPHYGASFITEGYLYPAGTLDADSVGVNADGSPEFPNKVIGAWTCRGWVVSETMGMDGSPTAITTQTFHLNDEYDNAMIVTEGHEYMFPDGPFTRAITGGAGSYRSARGEQIQEVLNINEYMGVVLRFTLRLEN